jgi:hypothetical protein
LVSFSTFRVSLTDNISVTVKAKMSIRPASLRDIPSLSYILTQSFGPDPLFKHLFPYQSQYPADFERALRESLYISFFDYRKSIFVSYLPEEDVKAPNERLVAGSRVRGQGREVLTGMAEWECHVPPRRGGTTFVGLNGEALGRGVSGWWDISTYMSFDFCGGG